MATAGCSGGGDGDGGSSDGDSSDSGDGGSDGNGEDGGGGGGLPFRMQITAFHDSKGGGRLSLDSMTELRFTLEEFVLGGPDGETTIEVGETLALKELQGSGTETVVETAIEQGTYDSLELRMPLDSAAYETEDGTTKEDVTFGNDDPHRTGIEGEYGEEFNLIVRFVPYKEPDADSWMLSTTASAYRTG